VLGDALLHVDDDARFDEEEHTEAVKIAVASDHSSQRKSPTGAGPSLWARTRPCSPQERVAAQSLPGPAALSDFDFSIGAFQTEGPWKRTLPVQRADPVLRQRLRNRAADRRPPPQLRPSAGENFSPEVGDLHPNDMGAFELHCRQAISDQTGKECYLEAYIQTYEKYRHPSGKRRRECAAGRNG
jgi:hypothetical protein